MEPPHVGCYENYVHHVERLALPIQQMNLSGIRPADLCAAPCDRPILNPTNFGVAAPL
jgi:hypothetical protein